MKTLKNFLFIAAAALTLATISFASGEQNSEAEQAVADHCYTCYYDQCHATAKSTGQRCRHCVSASGDLYCWQHK
jgi:hypothetical protein